MKIEPKFLGKKISKPFLFNVNGVYKNDALKRLSKLLGMEYCIKNGRSPFFTVLDASEIATINRSIETIHSAIWKVII